MKIIKKYNLSNNSWGGNTPRSLMLHTTLGGGNITGVVTTLEQRNLSYNYVIKGKQVYELVPWNRSAWHAGVIRSINLRARSFFGPAVGPDNPNRHSIGIAFEKRLGEALTEDDIDSFVALAKYLGKETGVRYVYDNIFAHREVTIDKPEIVLQYKEQCVDALVRDKDMKDVGKAGNTELLRRVLIEIIKRYMGLK